MHSFNLPTNFVTKQGKNSDITLHNSNLVSCPIFRQPLVNTTELAQTVSMSTFVTVPTQAMKDQIVKSTSMSAKATHVPTMLHAWTASKTTLANVSQVTRAKIVKKIFTNVI